MVNTAEGPQKDRTTLIVVFSGSLLGFRLSERRQN
jgi:hypothetical protein